jgi:hypothetical protein
MAKTVPEEYYEDIQQLVLDEERVSSGNDVFTKVIEDKESEDLGCMRDYLVQLGVVSRAEGEDGRSEGIARAGFYVGEVAEGSSSMAGNVVKSGPAARRKIKEGEGQ